MKTELRRFGAGVSRVEMVGLVPQRALLESAQHYLQVFGFSVEDVVENRVDAILGGRGIATSRGAMRHRCHRRCGVARDHASGNGGAQPRPPGTVRIATFNIFELSCAKIEAVDANGHRGEHPQVREAATILRHVQPDIVLINEIDYSLSPQLCEALLGGVPRERA